MNRLHRQLMNPSLLSRKINDELIHCWLKEDLIAMGTDVDRTSDSVNNHRDDDFLKLETEFRRLQEKHQELISERTHIESELRNVKKQAGRLEEEVRHLRAPHSLSERYKMF